VLERYRARFPTFIDRRGVVRQFSEDGRVLVRWDDVPGELDECRLWDLVREDHDGEDPRIEFLLVVSESRVLTYEDLI